MLSAILALTALPGAVPEACAAENDLNVNLNAVKGAYITHGSARYGIVYDEDVFRQDSTNYDHHLATMSAALGELAAKTSYSGEGQSLNIRKFLEDNGFAEFMVNDAYNREATDDSVCVACAHKKLKVGSEEYTLLAVVPRGGTYDSEWNQNFIFSSSADDRGDHAGYRVCSDEIERFVGDYVSDCGLQGKLKIWTAGYSRGAGIVNIFAGDLVNDPEAILGDRVSLSSDDLYCYTFGTMRSAAVTDKEGASAKYGGIHNVFESTELPANTTPASFGLGRYGQNTAFSEYASADQMLAYLKTEAPGVYKKFTENSPYEFTPYKLDSEALAEGTLEFIPDGDSYLPDNISDYLAVISESIGEFSARSSETGRDSREGFYQYQEAARNLLRYVLSSGKKSQFIEELTGSSQAVPFVISAYLTFLTDKADSEKSTQLNDAIEGGFNTLAYLVEDENGDIRSECRSIQYEYNRLKTLLFTKDPNYTENDGEDAGAGNVPKRYQLRRKVYSTSAALRIMKKLTGRFYGSVIGETLKKLDADEETIELLTNEEDCETMGYILSYLLLGNTAQSKGLPEFSLNNEQFRHIATLMGNISRYSLTHDIDVIISWLRAADSYYVDYEKPNDTQMKGYRRVYISRPDGVSVHAEITDSSGNTVAELENDTLISRSDEWIGYTTDDEQGWLRLPLDQEYKVKITADRSASLGVKVTEYSVTDGSETEPSGCSWKEQKINADGYAVLTVPAVLSDAGLTSGAAYAMRVEEGTVKAENTEKTEKAAEADPLPVPKKVKVSSTGKKLTVKWKKLSAAQRKAVTKIEVQYSRYRSFRSAATVSKTVSPKKSSLKVKKLKKGRKYYVRVRTISNKNGTKSVSGWSKIRKIKIK